MLGILLSALLPLADNVLFGFGWDTFLVKTQPATSGGPPSLSNLSNPHDLLLAVKQVLPSALALAAFLLGTTMHIGRTAMRETVADDAGPPVTGLRDRLHGWSRIARNTLGPQVAVMRSQAGVLLFGCLVVSTGGLGTLFFLALFNADFPVLGSVMFIFIAFLAASTVLQGFLSDHPNGDGTGAPDNRRSTAGWSMVVSTVAVVGRPMDQLRDATDPHDRERSPTIETDSPRFSQRLRSTPWPAVVWLFGVLVLVAVEFGAIVNTLVITIPGSPPGFVAALTDLPTLLSREMIPNMGYRTPSGGWTSTFLGLEPAVAWILRVLVVYAYAVVWLAWIWVGYLVYRSQYRTSHWTPTDGALVRLRDHRWGRFGAIVVFVFVVGGVFAPTLGPVLGPTSVAPDAIEEYKTQKITYYDEQTGSVETIPVGLANIKTVSTGTPRRNVGPLSYDTYGRFHPFGTTSKGRDLFTLMLYGARTYLFIGGLAPALAGFISFGLVVLTMVFGNVIDQAVGVAGEVVTGLPVLPTIFLFSLAFAPTWVVDVYNRAFLFGLLFGAFLWPDFWQTIRGSVLRTQNHNQPSEQGRLRLGVARALRSVIGPLAVYAALSMSGFIAITAALGISGTIFTPLTEWGFFFRFGESLITTASWHMPIIPAAAIVLVSLAFNGLAVGIRDAIDPKTKVEAPSSVPDEPEVEERPLPAEAATGRRSLIAYLDQSTNGIEVTPVKSVYRILKTLASGVRGWIGLPRRQHPPHSGTSRGEE